MPEIEIEKHTSKYLKIWSIVTYTSEKVKIKQNKTGSTTLHPNTHDAGAKWREPEIVARYKEKEYFL